MNTGSASERRGWTRLIAVSYLALGACGPGDSPPAEVSAGVVDPVAGARIREHIEVLAADAMQGREAGTPGHEKAADYLATEFSRIGLQPLGDNDTWLQNIDFLETRLVAGSASMGLQRGDRVVALEFGTDFVVSGGFGDAAESMTAPLVFVGFGIRAPEYDHDDFAGVDVSGKILVEFTGAPPGFANDERAYYSSSTGKQALAVELGAAGIVTIRTPVDRQRLTWPRVVASAASSGMRWLEPGGAPHEGFAALVGTGTLGDSAAEALFRLAGRDLDALFERHTAGGTGSFDMKVSATMSRQSVQRRRSSPNVLAVLPGSDRKLRSEYVLLTAHLDHLGIRTGNNGDAIHNGAYDNAAGTAVIIEVARALAGLSPAPRRSVMFAAVTAEEKGMRGSDFLAHYPPVPIASIVANINIDMPYLGFPIADVEGLGVEHSTLHGALARAARQLDMALTPDPHPELVRLIRSDQFSFVRQGVPGLNLKPGSRSSDPAIDGSEQLEEFLREHYHAPSDDPTLPFSEESARRFLGVAVAFSVLVANEDSRPAWKDGDFFAARFARSDAP